MISVKKPLATDKDIEETEKACRRKAGPYIEKVCHLSKIYGICHGIKQFLIIMTVIVCFGWIAMSLMEKVIWFPLISALACVIISASLIPVTRAKHTEYKNLTTSLKEGGWVNPGRNKADSSAWINTYIKDAGRLYLVYKDVYDLNKDATTIDREEDKAYFRIKLMGVDLIKPIPSLLGYEEDILKEEEFNFAVIDRLLRDAGTQTERLVMQMEQEEGSI